MEALCTLGTLSKSKRQLAYCTLQLQIKEVQKQVAIASSCEYMKFVLISVLAGGLFFRAARSELSTIDIVEMSPWPGVEVV